MKRSGKTQNMFRSSMRNAKLEAKSDACTTIHVIEATAVARKARSRGLSRAPQEREPDEDDQRRDREHSGREREVGECRMNQRSHVRERVVRLGDGLIAAKPGRERLALRRP